MAWLQLQYQQQLEAAIANMLGSVHPSTSYKQALKKCYPTPLVNAALPGQGSPTPLVNAALLENTYMQANLNSLFLQQQWAESLVPQSVGHVRQFSSAQELPFPRRSPNMCAHVSQSKAAQSPQAEPQTHPGAVVGHARAGVQVTVLSISGGSSASSQGNDCPGLMAEQSMFLTLPVLPLNDGANDGGLNVQTAAGCNTGPSQFDEQQQTQ